MVTITLIVLARAVHVMAGVMWAGTMFMMGMIVLPIAIRHGAEGAGRWTGMIMGKLGPASGIAAILTILSGLYLFPVLHPKDTSPSGLVLMTGAAAALVSFIVGAAFGRPAAFQLAKLNEQAAGGAPSPDVAARMAALRGRVVTLSRVNVVLIALAVLCMAVFRYVQAL